MRLIVPSGVASIGRHVAQSPVFVKQVGDDVNRQLLKLILGHSFAGEVKMSNDMRLR